MGGEPVVARALHAWIDAHTAELERIPSGRLELDWSQLRNGLSARLTAHSQAVLDPGRRP